VSQLGNDPEEPRLEYASEHILAHSAELEQASRALTEGLRRWAAAEHRRMVETFTLALAAAVVLGLGLMLLLYAHTLAPLRRTIQGFQRVADGDFGHRIAVEGSAEVRDLSAHFNRLAERLDLLFQLIDRLQSGGNLNEVVGFVAGEFGSLLRMDWMGVVLVGPDGASARLEAGHLDGAVTPTAGPPFPLGGTLVARALAEGRPLRIADLSVAAATHALGPLSDLVVLNMRDAVILPLDTQTQSTFPAAVVFAARRADSYDAAHLRFLGNIAHLIAHSFGRTVRFAEQGRLAAIGEFASGIAHELRTPLATVSLALDGLQGEGLQGRAQRRLELARQEASRMARLLDDILLFAKPLALNLSPVDPGDALRGFIAGHGDLALPRNQHLLLARAGARTRVLADRDRLTQIFLNLTRNACEAAPEGAEICWDVSDEPAEGLVRLSVANPGPAIPPDLLRRVTQPFVTSKATGTGLGLAIVNRLVQAHGGGLEIASVAGVGTRVEILLPRATTPHRGRDPKVPAAPALNSDRSDASS
jgi:signal transduction histidine kinase